MSFKGCGVSPQGLGTPFCTQTILFFLWEFCACTRVPPKGLSPGLSARCGASLLSVQRPRSLSSPDEAVLAVRGGTTEVALHLSLCSYLLVPEVSASLTAV